MYIKQDIMQYLLSGMHLFLAMQEKTGADMNIWHLWLHVSRLLTVTALHL
jgi:hypothetical protein